MQWSQICDQMLGLKFYGCVFLDRSACWSRVLLVGIQRGGHWMVRDSVCLICLPRILPH